MGPVSEKSKLNGGNGWVVRKEEGAVLPWNIEEKIDMTATSREFVERMVRRCSYLSDERVLPKGSLLYERFCVLNEINAIKVDGVKIPVEIKQDLYSKYFKKARKLPRKNCGISYCKRSNKRRPDGTDFRYRYCSKQYLIHLCKVLCYLWRKNGTGFL